VICAVVPARGGSKGLPRKNLRLLNGRPLIAYAIEAGLTASLVDRVIVSTDDEEIAGVARQCGADVPFLRPPHLAADAAPTPPVVRHAVEWLEAGGARVDATVVLQPTAPFRRGTHVDSAIDLLQRTGAGSVVSVCEFEHSPYWMYALESGRLVPLLPDARNRARRQDQPALYRLNGALYVTRRDVLMGQGLITSEDAQALVMTRNESVDIENEADLRWAEWLVTGSRMAR
jgi:CMP-N,N'-diacetyllegionaminic acid synthase